ncbi:MAG: 2-keto-4-pentenoate hydratase [Alphaproteobacteria bacterium]|nr:2-keto-4-pentenoate hydratase [Alphaproteobacteria bacterium]MDE2629546.1 2-keto-4-pentenoate hydratase [Alphaproteobacteria bacterium]
MEAVDPVRFAPANRIAQRFAAARLNATALDDYPGPIPPDLASAYECQEAAIALWPDAIAGWKIGRIPPAYEQRLGQARLAGPIFRREVLTAAKDKTVEFGVFVGGFAAVEAEYIYEIAKDAPAGQLRWSLNDAAAIAGRMFVGIETAGSPLAAINNLGPTVVVSDFGNNAGLILGPEVPGWRDRSSAALTCETFIQGKSVGQGAAANVLGGPLGALQFVAEHCAGRGRPLKAGMLISTGAATGIHDIVLGQKVRVEFKGIATIHGLATARAPQKP